MSFEEFRRELITLVDMNLTTRQLERLWEMACGQGRNFLDFASFRATFDPQAQAPSSAITKTKAPGGPFQSQNLPTKSAGPFSKAPLTKSSASSLGGGAGGASG